MPGCCSCIGRFRQLFEQTENEVLLSDTVADAVKKNIITPEGSRRRDTLAPGLQTLAQKRKTLTEVSELLSVMAKC